MKVYVLQVHSIDDVEVPVAVWDVAGVFITHEKAMDCAKQLLGDEAVENLDFTVNEHDLE